LFQRADMCPSSQPDSVWNSRAISAVKAWGRMQRRVLFVRQGTDATSVTEAMNSLEACAIGPGIPWYGVQAPRTKQKKASFGLLKLARSV
jgi:hypothetical protein